MLMPAVHDSRANRTEITAHIWILSYRVMGGPNPVGGSSSSSSMWVTCAVMTRLKAMTTLMGCLALSIIIKVNMHSAVVLVKVVKRKATWIRCSWWTSLRAAFSAMTHLTTLTTGSFGLGSKCSFYPLRLTKRELLTIPPFHRLCDKLYRQFLWHFEKLRHGLDQKLELAGFRSFDRLGHLLFRSRNTVVDVFTSRYSGIPSFFAEIATDSKGAIRAGATSCSNSMAVAVKNMRGKVSIDGPFM